MAISLKDKETDRLAREVADSPARRLPTPSARH
jgi:hypothetical protein